MIKGGATIWARKTIDSEIFTKKPAMWFKIWFLLVNKASHTDTDKNKRGEMYVHYEWISLATKATRDQVKKALNWLRENDMVSTRRSTRGVYIKVLKYGQYQDISVYKYKDKTPVKALEKHQRSTREAPRYYNNENNVNNEKLNTGAKAPDKSIFNKKLLEYPIQDIFDFIEEKNRPGIVGQLRKANKQNPGALLKAYLEAKELGKPYLNYIFKVYNNLIKK